MKKYLLSVVLLTYCVITFGQPPVTKNVATAGTLSFTPTELTTITELIVKGTIDARDFKSMGNLTSLQKLDLSAASIATYTGTGGTGGSSSQTYPANTIPIHTFGNVPKLTLQNVVLPTNCTAVGDYAFNGCTGITDVTFSSQITSIGISAFDGCSSLLNIDLGTSNPTIGNYAFNDCRGITNAKLGNATTLGINAFSNCSNLTTIDLGNSLTSIGDNAFNYCSKLTNITFPNSLTNIGANAFLGCASITSINIPQATTTIGTSAFYSMSKLTSFKVASNNTAYSDKDDILMNKAQTTIIQCPIQKSGSYTIPLTVSTIDVGAFFECTNITQIIISKNVTTINSKAFGACSALKSVIALPSIPPDLNGGDCFVGNTITSAYTNSTSLAAYQLKPEWRNIRITSFPKISVDNVTPGNLATDILQKYLSQGLKLSSITSLTVTGELNDKDFAEIIKMPLLSELNISGVKTQSGTVPTGLFANNQIITEVYLPSKLKKIPNSCFANCQSLKLFSPFPTDSIGDYAFDNCSAYLNSGLAFPSTIKYIGKAAFRSCTSISGSCSLPDSLQVINDSTFIGCNKLNGMLIFPTNTKTISKSAFENCSSFSSINFGKNTTTIGENAFKGCTGVLKMTVPNTTPPSINANTFIGIDKENTLVYVPNEAQATYQSNTQWKEFIRILPAGLSKTKIITVKMNDGGILNVKSTNYINGTKIILTTDTLILAITPLTGYKVEKVEIEGIDVTAYNLTTDGSGKFTYQRLIGANTDLIVTFAKAKYTLTIKNGNVNIIQEYEVGSTPKFTFTATSGSTLNGVFYNQSDVTSKLVNGTYTLDPPITSNSFITLSTGTSTKVVEANLVKVYTSDNEIFVEGSENGEEIKLYSVNGIQLQSIISTGERIIIPINQKGTYLVKTSNATYKVVL